MCVITLYSNTLFTGSCAENRAISSIRVAFGPTTATLCSSPRSIIRTHTYTYSTLPRWRHFNSRSYENNHTIIYYFTSIYTTLTRSKMQNSGRLFPRTTGCCCQGNSKFGVCDAFPDHERCSHHIVLHERVIPHERQHFIRQFQAGLKALFPQSTVQTLTEDTSLTNPKLRFKARQ